MDKQSQGSETGLELSDRDEADEPTQRRPSTSQSFRAEIDYNSLEFCGVTPYLHTTRR